MRWNLPGGKIDPGETPARAAAREAHEESGLRVGSIVPLTRERTRIGTMDVFLARQWSGHVELLDGEHVSHAWVPRAQAADWDVVPVQRRLLRWYARLQL